jgi:DNA-binding response OmpR family regulator
MAIILIIDDELPMRRLLTRALNDAGHTVYDAPDGGVGLQLFRDVGPALVITDIVMPDVEGIEMIRKVRGDDQHVPILAISGSDPIYLHFATELGATAALRKPFAVDQLLTTVDALLCAEKRPVTAADGSE